MKCASCGFDNAAEMKFCGGCGAALVNRCPRCSFENPPGHKFCGECGTALGAAAAARKGPARDARNDRSVSPIRIAQSSDAFGAQHAATDSSLASSKELERGERKTVTALFADIKGSMELMESLDPEDARAIVDPALARMIEAVRRYEGYVVQSTGDGIFALFGAPVAHEDHPARALFAALMMNEQIRLYADRLRLEKGVNLEIRVGVNTGEMVVRPIRTAESHVEYTPIGHSTGLAQRMQQIARPGSIVVSDHTRRLTEGYFKFRALGPAQIKGLSAPLEVFEVVGVGALRTRLQAAAARRGLSRFVGRQAELDHLRRAMDLAVAGHGQVVAAVGEAGVGKSRLFHEFTLRLGAGHLLLEAASFSYGKASAYLPVIELLRTYFAIGADDDDRTRREKIIGRLFGLDRALEDVLPYLLRLLTAGGAASPWEQTLDRLDEYLHEQQGKQRVEADPVLIRRRTTDAIRRLILRESLDRPVIVIFEDLHWIDEETQALLDALVDSIATARVLLLVNYRPEYRHQWAHKTYYAQLRLDPLGVESASEMLSVLLGPAPEMDALKRIVIERTEGNPFFMEEMVQALIDQGVVVSNGAIRIARPLADAKIPPTVQGIIASRIDRLSARDKELLQTMSVMGRELPLGLVRRVIGHADGDLEDSLANLRVGEFVYEQPALETEYVFKHALTQEVAYGSVLTERRKTLHEQTGAAIEELYADNLDDHLAELAHHYGHSNNAPKAIEYLGRAGFRALSRSAYGEAVANTSAAIALLDQMPDSDRRAGLELPLQMTLGVALMAAKGFGAPELERAYRRALELCNEDTDPSQRFAILQGLWAHCFVRHDFEGAFELAEQSMEIAQRSGHPGLLRDAHRALGQTMAMTRRIDEARSHLEQAWTLRESERPTPQGLRWGPDANVLILTTLSQVLFDLGFPDRALKAAQDAVAEVSAKTDPFSLAMALSNLSDIHSARREPEAGEKYAHAVAELARENQFPFWTIGAQGSLGVAYILQGKFEEGVRILRERIKFPDTGAIGAPTILAEGLLRAGHLDEARRIASELVNTPGRRAVTSPREYRVLADIMAAQRETAEAERLYRESIGLAQLQHSRVDELRSSVGLARLLAAQSRGKEARDALAPIYGSFTEGLELPDLVAAADLLKELR